MDDEVEVFHVTEEELNTTISTALDVLTASDWLQWAAECHVHCSHFPSPEARQALRSLDTAAWLLDGSNFRKYLHIARRERDK